MLKARLELTLSFCMGSVIFLILGRYWISCTHSENKYPICDLLVIPIMFIGSWKISFTNFYGGARQG